MKSLHRAAATRLLHTFILLPALLLAACADSGGGGNAKLVMALSSADVTSAAVTISGAGISPDLVAPLTREGDQWVALVQKIPAGTDRAFVADAFDASGTVIYQGQATGVTITKGSTVVVAIIAQQVDVPPTSHNAAPIIDAVVVSAVAIAPSETIAIGVQAHDPNAGESLSYAWSGAGTFSAASSAATSWSAPGEEGTYPLTIAVSDPNGETASMSFPVSVSIANGKGDASVTVTINTWPSISDLSAAPTRLAAAGSMTSLDVAASDADGDVLAYEWSVDCSGSFSAATEKAPTFTLGTLPDVGSCMFTVTVTDGRGGTNTGTLNLPTGPEPAVNQAPQIAVASQSKATANPGETVDLYVQASDPEGTALTFSWSATAGTLSAPTTTAATSAVTWTAPTAFSAADIAVIVTDATGQATTQSFGVGPAVDPACPPDWGLVPRDALSMGPSGTGGQGLRATYSDGTVVLGEGPLWFGPHASGNVPSWYPADSLASASAPALWQTIWGIGGETLTGYIKSPRTGLLDIGVWCDDYCSIDIPGVISAVGDNSAAIGQADVQGGQWYPITVGYQNRWGSNGVSFDWRCP